MTHRIRHFGLRWLGIVLAMALLTGASAMAEVDLGKTGTIAVRIHTAEGVNVAGAHIGLYRVGDAVIADNNLCFELTADFAASGVSLDDLSDSGLAGVLASYAKANGRTAYAEAGTDGEGRAEFAGLTAGLYLVMQDGFAEGKDAQFSEIQPFIVTVPMTNEAGTGWTYQIEAQPKVNPVTTPAPTPAPTEPPKDENLPQTGMLRWPIPVLGVGGLALFSIGWALFFGKKKAERNA